MISRYFKGLLSSHLTLAHKGLRIGCGPYFKVSLSCTQCAMFPCMGCVHWVMTLLNSKRNQFYDSVTTDWITLRSEFKILTLQLKLVKPFIQQITVTIQCSTETSATRQLYTAVCRCGWKTQLLLDACAAVCCVQTRFKMAALWRQFNDTFMHVLLKRCVTRALQEMSTEQQYRKKNDNNVANFYSVLTIPQPERR
jgi:hypothetical protein